MRMIFFVLICAMGLVSPAGAKEKGGAGFNPLQWLWPTGTDQPSQATGKVVVNEPGRAGEGPPSGGTGTTSPTGGIGGQEGGIGAGGPQGPQGAAEGPPSRGQEEGSSQPTGLLPGGAGLTDVRGAGPGSGSFDMSDVINKETPSDPSGPLSAQQLQDIIDMAKQAIAEALSQGDQATANQILEAVQKIRNEAAKGAIHNAGP